MSSLTPFFKFKLPSLSDLPNIMTAVTDNLRVIDEALAKADCGDWNEEGAGDGTDPNGCDCAEE
jgi:hypothetical protein